MPKIIIITLLFLFAFIVQLVNSQIGSVGLRSVSVKGVVKCGSTAVEGVKVRLFRVSSNDVSQVLDTQTSGPSGIFELSGNTNGRAVNETELAPVIKFYHSCDDEEDVTKKKGFRRFQLGVPSDFVSIGRKYYDVGVLNLQVIYPNEAREKET